MVIYTTVFLPLISIHTYDCGKAETQTHAKKFLIFKTSNVNYNLKKELVQIITWP